MRFKYVEDQLGSVQIVSYSVFGPGVTLKLVKKEDPGPMNHPIKYWSWPPLAGEDWLLLAVLHGTYGYVIREGAAIKAQGEVLVSGRLTELDVQRGR